MRSLSHGHIVVIRSMCDAELHSSMITDICFVCMVYMVLRDDVTRAVTHLTNLIKNQYRLIGLTQITSAIHYTTGIHWCRMGRECTEINMHAGF